MKLSIIGIVAMFLGPVVAQAKTPAPKAGAVGPAIQCASQVAQAKIWSDDKGIHFRLVDTLGFDDFPLYEGVVNTAMMPYLERESKDLKVIGGELEVLFPKDHCKWDSKRKDLVLCSGGGRIVAPQTKDLHVSDVSTTVETDQRLDLSYQRIKFNMGLDTATGPYAHYFLAFPFDRTRCVY